MTSTLMADVVPERVRWLWPGRIPFGKLTILDGDPGLGKSTVMLHLAACLSLGQELPGGGQHPPCGTIVLMVEDGLADTVVPRLMNAGADLTRVISLDSVADEEGAGQLPSIPSCIPDLANLVPVVGARLIVIDPLLSYLGEKTHSRDGQAVRRALTPLAAYAQETGIAVVGLRHLNKASQLDVLYRGEGTIGFIGVARSGLIVARDPDDVSRNVLASSKSNLGPTPPSLAYRLVNCENTAARVDWEGVSQHTAQSLATQLQDDEARGDLAEAVEFLRQLLEGGPRLTKEVIRLSKDAGIAEKTLKRARAKLGVVADKAQTQDGPWTLGLPKKQATTPATVGDDHAGAKGASFSSQEFFDSSPSLTPFKKEGEEEKKAKESNSSKAVEEGHLFGDAQVAPFNGAVPVATVSGRGQRCAICGKPCFAYEGKPLLCTPCANGRLDAPYAGDTGAGR